MKTYGNCNPLGTWGEATEETTEGPDILDDDIKLDHLPDVAECRQILLYCKDQQFWPNAWHINERGNVDQLIIGYNGAKIHQSWV